MDTVICPVDHYSPIQTSPEIYVDRTRHPPGSRQEFSFHQWTISLTFSGSCQVTLGDNKWDYRGGWLHITRPATHMGWCVPDVKHRRARQTSAESESGWDSAWAVFHPRPHWLPWLDALSYSDGTARLVLTSDTFAATRDALINAALIYHSAGPMRDERSMTALEDILILIRIHSTHTDLAKDQRIAAAVAFIQSSINKPISVADIASHVNLSVSTLAHRFTRALNMPPAKYLETVRLGHAVEMLRYGEMSVGDIAKATGYGDSSYFTRRFRRLYGQTPTAYRAAYRPLAPSRTLTRKDV